MSNDSVHRIRLKGPWEIRLPGRDADSFERHQMPMDWRTLCGDVAGTALFRRKFHTPSGLEHGDRVCIHIPNGVGLVTEFLINQNSVEPFSTDPLKFDVTTWLNSFNQLQFSLTFDPEESPELPGGLWETVFVEIHSQ